VTYDLCFVPAIASFHNISWLENQSVSYLVIKFGNFCNYWSHKHVFYTRWLLILFLLLFYFREEKNVALAELRDDLVASKKSLESLRQEVSKKKEEFRLLSIFVIICNLPMKKMKIMFCVLYLTALFLAPSSLPVLLPHISIVMSCHCCFLC